MSILLFGIETGLSRLTIWLSAGLYYAAAFIFKVFLILSNGSVVSAEDYKLVLNNFYIIIGIVMLFLITFNLLKGMVNPDDQKGTSAIKKIIINFITSLIIITLLPTIFSFAFDFQTSILVKQNTIGRLFGYGSTNSNNSEENAINQVTSGANMIVNGVWTAFFNVNTDAFKECNVTDMTSLGECQNKVDGDDDALDDVIAEVERTGSFFKYTQFAGNITDDEVTYNFLLCLVGGFLLLYVGISYCLDMGVRLVKLAFYQIIAPIPIMLRVIPEGKLSGSFGKWVQITVTCYLEVFIRIFVLYFCVYLCIAIASSDFLNNSVWQYGFMTWLFTKAFIFMGLITFMKQAPKLISDITGIDSGNMKMGIKDKLKEGGLFTAGHALAAAGAGIGGLIAGKSLTSAYRAGKAGWKNGNFKGIGTEAQRRQAYKEALQSGATRRGMALNSVRGAFGFESTAEAAERKIKSGKTNVENNSHSAIEYTDGSGRTHTIMSGETAQIDDVTAEELKAKKTQNVGAMSDANDKMRDLDKKIKWAGSQKSWKSAMDDEADKKFNDGKYEHNIRYIDTSGNIYEEKVNGKRLSELSQQGMKFLNADESKDKFKASYIDNDGNIHEIQKDLSKAELDKLIAKYGEYGVQSSRVSVTEKKIRDEVRKAFSTSELSSDSPNLIKNKTESFFTTLANEGGFSYQSYVYDENGNQKYNEDGTAVIETGGFTSKVEDGKRVITHTFKDASGSNQEISYTSIGNGMVEYQDSTGEKKQMSVYDLSDMFDQKSKSTTGVLEAQKQDIAESKEFIRARDENEAIDAILKQRDEKVAEALQSEQQRGREAAKKYTANKK